jgi:catechol 2,3-dioxygenase-like lactoylglutathione lyase family enzyme
MGTATSAARRAGATAVHSLHRFVISVPDLDRAAHFYENFGLDVRRTGGRLDLYTHGHPHRWGSVHARNGPKRLEYLAMSAYEDDHDKLVQRLAQRGFKATAPHPLADEPGVWVTDPDGTPVQLVVGPKVTPSTRAERVLAPIPAPGKGAAPGRSAVQRVHPRRLSHVLLFSSDVPRSARFYCEAFGLCMSDYSGDIIAFVHGAHGSDHHLLAFAKSDGPGLHHSSWDVASFDDVGLGMEQMTTAGYPDGWGVGRHVLGSNYFRYVRDPWGSFAEYSYDIDFVGSDTNWVAADHPPEDSFYVWGPPPPDYFIVNHESAARRAELAPAMS